MAYGKSDSMQCPCRKGNSSRSKEVISPAVNPIDLNLIRRTMSAIPHVASKQIIIIGESENETTAAHLICLYLSIAIEIRQPCIDERGIIPCTPKKPQIGSIKRPCARRTAVVRGAGIRGRGICCEVVRDAISSCRNRHQTSK